MAVNKIAGGFGDQATLALVSAEFSKRSRAFMQEDLDKSGIDEHDIYAEPLLAHNGAYVSAAYRIPYWNREGEQRKDMYRDRLRYSVSEAEQKELGLPRYKGPSRSVTGTDVGMPYLYPGGEGELGLICEGEKKTVAAQDRFGVPVLGIGGKDMWMMPRKRIKKGEKSVAVGPKILHEDISWWIIAKNLREVIIVPDGDVVTNKDVASAYSNFYMRLMLAHPEVKIRIVDLGDGAKLDDLLVEQPTYNLDNLLECREVLDLEFNADLAMLVQEYDLDARVTEKSVFLYNNAHNIGNYLEKFPTWAGEIRYNEESNLVEMYGKPMRPGLHEHKLCATFNKRLHMHELSPVSLGRGLLRVALDNAYSPAAMEIQRLDKWDGVARIKFINGEKASVDSEAVLETIVCGYVKRALQPGCDWRILVTLVGPQGVGKSSFARWLAGGTPLKDAPGVVYIAPEELRGGDKDVRIRMAGARITLLDDIEHFGGKISGALKGIISRTHETVRRPYAATDEVMPRRGIILGTSNLSYIIPEDSTGNTRFAVLEVLEKFDWDWLEEWRGQILAEALSLLEDKWESRINFKDMDKHVIKDKLSEAVSDWLYDWSDGTFEPDNVMSYKLRGVLYVRAKHFWKTYKGDYDARVESWEHTALINTLEAAGCAYIGNEGKRMEGVQLKRVWTLASALRVGRAG